MEIKGNLCFQALNLRQSFVSDTARAPIVRGHGKEGRYVGLSFHACGETHGLFDISGFAPEPAPVEEEYEEVEVAVEGEYAE